MKALLPFVLVITLAVGEQVSSSPPTGKEQASLPPIAKINETQGEALRTTLQQMLKLDVPTDQQQSNQLNSKEKDILPKHMLELYEKYNKETTGVAETIRSIEPLKDYKPKGLDDMLIFNMSSVAKVDKLKTARFHMRRRKVPRLPEMDPKTKKMRLPPYRIRLYQLLIPLAGPGEPEPVKLRSLDTIILSQVTAGGWLSVEISSALKEMFNSPGPSPGFMFGARFEGPRGKVISSKRFLRTVGKELSSSFIVVFLEDSNSSDSTAQDIVLSSKHVEIMSELFKNAANNSKSKNNTTEKGKRGSKRIMKDIEESLKAGEHIRHSKKYYKRKLQPKATPGEEDISELLDFDMVKTVKQVRRALRRHNHKNINGLNIRYDPATKSVVEKKSNSVNEVKDRKRRALSQDELDDYIKEYEEKKNLLEDKTTTEREFDKEDDMGDLTYYEPDVYMHEKLIPKKYQMRYRKKLDNEDYNDDLSKDEGLTFNEVLNDGNGGYNYHFEEVPFLTIDKLRHNKMKRIKLRKSPKVVEKKHENKEIAMPKPVPCHKAQLSIKFSDINWDWIIAPEKFEAGFCIGSCSSNLMDVKRTNHSVIVQSFVHKYNLMQIPDACCVPAKLKPVNLLYMDPVTKDVVLKTFQNMQVESCECR